MRSLPRIVLLSCVPAAAGPPDVPVWANEASRAGKARVAPKRSGRTRNAWDNVNENATRHWPLRTRGVKAETRRVAVGGSRLVARAFRLFEPIRTGKWHDFRRYVSCSVSPAHPRECAAAPPSSTAPHTGYPPGGRRRDGPEAVRRVSHHRPRHTRTPSIHATPCCTA